MKSYKKIVKNKQIYTLLFVIQRLQLFTLKTAVFSTCTCTVLPYFIVDIK